MTDFRTLGMCSVGMFIRTLCCVMRLYLRVSVSVCLSVCECCVEMYKAGIDTSLCYG